MQAVADYIDSSILCESYIYVPVYDLTEERQGIITRNLQHYAGSRAPLFFGSEISVDAAVTEGSLKIKVTIVGSIALLLSQYGNLRSGIEYLFKDAQFVASSLVTESMFNAGVRRNDVGRVEVRTGVPGALKRVLNRMDALAESSRTISPDDFAEQFAGIRAEISRIIDTIPSQEDKKAVAKEMGRILHDQYPKPPALPPEPESGEQEAPILLRDEIEDFLNELENISRVGK